MTSRLVRRTAGVLAGGAALAAATYGLYAGVAWLRYGHAALPHDPGEEDDVLDRFMPLYDVVERHHIEVAAPADVTFETARNLNGLAVPIARALFKVRDVVMRASPPEIELPHHLVDAMQAIGWRVLAELRDRELMIGAVTKPWEAVPVFRGVSPLEFVSFAEPGYVKIVLALRADPVSEHASIFRTETRAVATDNASRVRFRRYWALVSPGVALIRRGLLVPVKAAAESKGAVAPA